MYPPKIAQLIRDLRDPGVFNLDPPQGFFWVNDGKYSHYCLSDYIVRNYNCNDTHPAFKGITSSMMSAGSYLGLNVIQIRDLFLPHTVKKDWDDITVEEVIKVLEDLQTSDRVRWWLVTEAHMKLGSLQELGEVHDPKHLQSLSEP